MGCLIEIVFSKKSDDARMSKFYKRHRTLFAQSDLVSKDKTDGDRTRDRRYVLPGIEHASKYIHDTLRSDSRIVSVKIIS